ncbi:MAG: glycerophosphodiester phosphodiesterase [Promethearchaeota archaeon]
MSRAKNFEKRPEILAHRMLRVGYPENTILSLQKVIELGIDWVEFDVQTLKDGVIVSMHDSTVDRTTDGSGILIKKTFDEVKKLNAGKGYDFGFIPVPTVEDILNELSKAPYPIKAEMHLHNLEEPEKLIEMLESNGLLERCYFNTDLVGLAEYIRYDLGISKAKISFNVATSDIEPYRKFSKELGISYFCVSLKYLNADLVDSIHSMENGNEQIFVHSYPVQTEDGWQKMLNIGVDVIQTDYPDALREFLKEKGFTF